MSTARKTTIPMKGPKQLAPEAIKDICENRATPNAVRILAKKHGISENRVKSIWGIYYGGTTLKDYGTGLKKPLPEKAVDQTDLTRRVIKTERGIYETREPKTMRAAAAADIGSRATAIRKQKAKPQPPKDLDLDNVGDMDDNDARILAGEMQAGNNSAELLEAVERLIEHHQNISERTLVSLEKALESANRRRHSRRDDASDTDYSVTTDIDDEEDNVEDTDDSTAVYRSPAKAPARARPQRQPDEYRQLEQEFGDSGVYDGDAMGQYEEPVMGLDGPNQLGPQVRQRPPGHSTRAQPVYRAVRDRPIYSADQEQGYYSQAQGHEYEVPAAQYDPIQGRIQPNNGHDNAQQYQGPRQGPRIYSDSGIGPGAALSKYPWIKPSVW